MGWSAGHIFQTFNICYTKRPGILCNIYRTCLYYKFGSERHNKSRGPRVTDQHLKLQLCILYESEIKQLHFLTITPTRCTNFYKFILGIDLYMFRTDPLSIISGLALYTRQWYVSNRSDDSLLASCQLNLYVLLCVQC